MTEFRTTCRVHVASAEGMHLRRAAAVSECARHFPCELHITRGCLRADARSVVEILCLAASPGDELLLEADGPESLHALESISALIAW
ncbi:MAG: HPr family phosphocarrier protein [Isosphaeraceae bacterium]